MSVFKNGIEVKKLWGFVVGLAGVAGNSEPGCAVNINATIISGTGQV